MLTNQDDDGGGKTSEVFVLKNRENDLVFQKACYTV